MPVIYLRHPIHGTKVATMDAEANADVANGWKVYNPEEQVSNQLAEKIKAVEAVEAVEPTPSVEVKRRRKI